MGTQKPMSRSWVNVAARLLLIGFGLSDGDRVLDVGCGTGRLALTLPEIANVARVTGIDLTKSFVEFGRGWNTDLRINFRTADVGCV